MTRLKRRKELPSTERDDVRFGTPDLVAAYRARRIAELKPDTIIEVGAGAGFQTRAFASAAKVIAIDIDKERMSRGSFPEGCVRIAGDALDAGVIGQARKEATGKVAVFLDPERAPAAEHRRLSDIKPDVLGFIERYGAISQDIAIELPPFLSEAPLGCEREYLSVDGKLNRLTIYLGALRKSELSVVKLPGGERIEHSGPLPYLRETEVKKYYLLEPDAALDHAGLTSVALTIPVQSVAFGRKQCYFAEQRGGPFFTTYKVLAIGKDQVRKSLMSCGTLILHGSMSANDQRTLLRELNRMCKGHKRLHLFIGQQWCLAEKLTTHQ